MTTAERQVYSAQAGTRLTRLGAGLVRLGCTEKEALRILDYWFEVNVQYPSCAAEALDYYLEGYA